MKPETASPCEFGVEGPAPRGAPPMLDQTLPPSLQHCFAESGKVWGRTDAEMPAFIQAVVDLGATFFVYGAIPEQRTAIAKRLLWVGNDGSLSGLRRFSETCRGAGLTFYLNTQISSYSKEGDFFDERGRDPLSHPDGTYRWDLSDASLRAALQLEEFRGVLYDEAEWETIRNKNNCHDGAEGDGKGTGRIHPLFAPTEHLGALDAYDVVYRGAKRGADEYRAAGKVAFTEHVFPVMLHTFARAGMIACPKFLKEGVDPVFAAIALGAARQYGTEFWIAPDLWGKNGFPGHSPQELRCSLLFAYWMGATKIFVENIYADFLEGEILGGNYADFNSGMPMRNTGLLDRTVDASGAVSYAPSAYGEVFRSFVKEYVPAHPRLYSFRDVRPEIAIVRFDDSYWGQNHSWMPKGLHGGKDVAGPASTAWIGIWHLLTHGETSRHGITYWSDGWGDRPHDFFCPLNGVVVYDHLVSAECLEDVKLIFVTGIHISDQSLRAIVETVRRGAICIADPDLAPDNLRGRDVIEDGNGKWLLTRDFLSPTVQKLAAPFLGRRDEIRYRFGATDVVFKRGSNGNDVSVEIQTLSVPHPST